MFPWYLGPLIRRWHKPREGTGYPGLRSYLTEEDFHEWLYDASDELVSLMAPDIRDDEVFVEKTPPHALWVPEILETFPNARFVHVLRDARDATASILAASRSFGEGMPKRAISAARMWVRFVSAAEEARKKLNSNQFHELRYENLRKDPARELRSLTDFLNLEWSDEDLRKAIADSDPKNKSIKGAELRGEYAKQFGEVVKRREGAIRKARPGSWTSDLKFYDKWQVWLVARKKMKEVGYEW